MRKIPRYFQMFGKEIETQINDALLDVGAKGRAHEQKGIIELDIDLNQMSEEDVEVTYLHEVVHIIMKSLAYDELYHDEQFTDLLARALHQFLITSGIWAETMKDKKVIKKKKPAKRKK